MRKRSSKIVPYLLLPLISFYLFSYPWLRIPYWYSGDFSYTILWSSLAIWAIAMIGFWHSFRGPNMFIRFFFVHWMGASFILTIVTTLAEPFYWFNLIIPKQLALSVLLITGILCILAFILSHFVSIKRIPLFSHKVSKPYRIAHISDIHIGSRQGRYMERIVNKINQQQPDYVVITGDLIDTSAVGHDELKSLSNLSAPTYFCIGNHERYADLDKILKIMDDLSVKTLRQDHVELEDLIFLGIDDADRHDQINIMLPEITFHKGKYSILLYHKPSGWEFAIEHGVDLMLSGHTHNGQVFPFNYIVKTQFNYIKGLYQQGKHALYVSSGTGTWGPMMRLGSISEIAILEIRPHN